MTTSVSRDTDKDSQGQLVHCTHVVEPSAKAPSTRASRDSDASARGQQQWRSVQMLSGRSYVSPFYVDKEPDPATAPAHPSSTGRAGDAVRPAASTMPATFFVFADLSVRTAGVYRLKFRLMDWGSVMDTGTSQPVLAEVWSDPFRVCSSKDFPGMRRSSHLAERLRELGVKDLKARKGKGRGEAKQRTKVIVNDGVTKKKGHSLAFSFGLTSFFFSLNFGHDFHCLFFFFKPLSIFIYIYFS